MPLSEESQEKTAFITPDEPGEFTRAMFGLMNSQFYFSKLMQKVLEPLQNKIVIFYLDDILIPVKDWQSMMERLEEVLKLLRKSKLTLKLSKCEFGKRKVEYLGYILGENGIQPGPRKIEAIEKFPTPKDAHEVRRFIGLAGFFRRFVQNFSRKVAPLTKLTKKEQTFEWTAEQESAFNIIKSELVKMPTLQIYNEHAEKTELHTDASTKGLGAILLQNGSDGKMHLVYGISRRTSEVESVYHSSKLEM